MRSTIACSMIGQGGPDPALVKWGEAMVSEHARVLDAHLAGKTWIAGDRLTLADLVIAAPFMSIKEAKLPVSDHRHLLAWFGRVQELDAWKKTSS